MEGGGGTGQAEVGRAQAPKEQRTLSVATYFSCNSGDKTSVPDTVRDNNMATEHAEMEGVEEVVMKADLQQLEAAIVDKLSMKLADLIKPLQFQLDNIKTMVAALKKMAEFATEMALATQDSSRALQYEQENLKHKVLTLELEVKMMNIKICGFPEQSQSKTDLQILIATWMASVLKLEENIAPCLTKVRRVGAPKNPKRQGPRDKIATFLNARDKYVFMQEARCQGSLYYEGKRVEIY